MNKDDLKKLAQKKMSEKAQREVSELKTSFKFQTKGNKNDQHTRN